jgi:hemolysin activation/secretion protein
MRSAIIVGGFTLLVLFNSALAQEYPVSGFSFQYGNPRPGLPELEPISTLEVQLDRRDGVWVEAAADTGQPVQLGAIPPGSVFDGSGLNAVMNRVVRHFNDQGVMAVYVAPAEGQINPRNARDLRRDTQLLELTVWVGRVAEARTVARGYRFLKADTLNRPQHNRIIEKAPVVAADAQAEQAGLLVEQPINEYLMRLNRHPGRRVDLAISSGDQAGDLVVDFLVNEQKPWLFYAQVSNTGPESTGEWRARTGFVHYQITNADDILTLDFISDLKDTMAATASYSRPFIYPDYLGMRLRASWTDYTAAELAGGLVDYMGTTYAGGIEFYYRPFFWRNFSFEFNAGVKYQNISVASETVEERETITDASGDLILPYVGASIMRRERTYGVSASLQFETNVSSVDDTALNQLGRVNVDEGFMILSGGVQASVFLEPLFLRSRWGDPDAWQRSRLAHEVRFMLGGQYGFDKRMFAQTEYIIGGLDRVRGYPESIGAADSGFQASLEYAFHVPRALKPISVIRREAMESGDVAPPIREPFLGRYNLRPPDVFALPDWDLVLKAFLDVGATYVNDADFNESDFELMSAGIGIEVQLSSMFSIQVDWGTVLQALERGGEVLVDSGDNRLHVRAQISW